MMNHCGELLFFSILNVPVFFVVSAMFFCLMTTSTAATSYNDVFFFNRTWVNPLFSLFWKRPLGLLEWCFKS